MKKNIMTTATLLALTSLSSTSALAFSNEPTVYGKANLALEKNAEGNQTGVTVNSNKSRIGFKGVIPVRNNLKALYKWEFEVVPDAKTSFNNRNQYVGLMGGFGTVFLGRHDSPYKMSQPNDLFNDGVFDNASMTSVMKHGEDRFSNMLSYITPNFSGVKLVGAFIPDEGSNSELKDSNLTDISSFALIYGSKKKGIFLSAGLNAYSQLKDRNGLIAQESSTLTRFSAQYNLYGLITNVIYQMDDEPRREGTTAIFNMGYEMGYMTPKLKISNNTANKSSRNTGNVMAVGLDYELGKKTTAYFEFGTFDKQLANNVKVSSEQDTRNSIEKYSIGLIHKF